MATDRLFNSTQGDTMIAALNLIASKIGVEGGVYTAGNGIVINNDEVSVDTTIIPTISSISSTYLTQAAAASTYLTNVDTADIVTNAVTWEKLSSNVQNRIDQGGGGTADLSTVAEMINYADVTVVVSTEDAGNGITRFTIDSASGEWSIYDNDSSVTIETASATDEQDLYMQIYGYVDSSKNLHVGLSVSSQYTNIIIHAAGTYILRIYDGDIDNRLVYLENNALTSIPSNSVNTTQLVANSVIWSKLSSDVQTRINNSGIQVEKITDIDDFIEYNTSENVESVKFGEYNGTNYKVFVIGTNYNNKFVQYKFENDGIHYRLGTLSAITELPEWGMWIDISSGGGGGTDSRIGDLSNLTTTAKSTVVAAINEVDGDIGNLSTLTTTAKSSAVAAINEINSVVGQANAALETLINSGV